jgi:hypothetical protein
MEDQVPPNKKAGQAVAKKALQTERAQKARERERKQCEEFLKKWTLADVLLDAEDPKSLKGSTDTTALQSIRGVCPSLLGCNLKFGLICLVNGRLFLLEDARSACKQHLQQGRDHLATR